MSNAELVGGIPQISVFGTPRAMGTRLGLVLKPRLQVLAQFLGEQLRSQARSEGKPVNAAQIHDTLRATASLLASHEPSLWMELESIAHAAELSIDDVLIIHGYSDLFSHFRCQVPLAVSTYLSLTSQHTESGAPAAALIWQADPTLIPYLTLLHRIPAHGPASLSLTVAGLHPVAGLSEAGVAVASNEMRVNDGVSGHFTTHLLNSMLTAPSIEDAMSRGLIGPRHGGRAIHALAGNGDRFSLELSGQRQVRLTDNMHNAPRVHTNQPLADEIRPVALGENDALAKARLERIAGLAVNGVAIRTIDVLGWFGLAAAAPASSPTPRAMPERDAPINPESTVVVIIDPAARELHLRRCMPQTRLDMMKL